MDSLINVTSLDSLINVTSLTWNSGNLVIGRPHDAKIIESIPLNQSHIADKDGWHSTNNGKYTVKYGYQMERVYPYREKNCQSMDPQLMP